MRDSVDPVTLDLDTLRPYPDAGDPDSRAHDAADRLLLDESAEARQGVARREIAVIGDMLELGPTGPELHRGLASAVAESGIAGYELLSWYGLAVPKATSAALIQKINQQVTGILNAADVKAKFAAAPKFPLPLAPKVSVVVACYNGARTLHACLHSLERLNYPDYEVILVDDGSTDTTPQIAAQFRKVRTIRHENCGLSVARNTGSS